MIDKETWWMQYPVHIEIKDVFEYDVWYLPVEVTLVPPKESEKLFIAPLAPPCPNCGSMSYRIIYTDDEMTEVDFYDCLMCRHSWC